MTNKYTLDRVDNGYFVFLKHPDETEELLVPEAEVRVQIAEGDIVRINKKDSGHVVEVFEKETEDMKDKVSSLLEKLKNKK